jgi:DNA (cytosine-5)-methyltransferase 1
MRALSESGMARDEDGEELVGGEVPDQGSGWPLEPRERMDFLHRIRTFPGPVAEWRKRMVTLVEEDRELFPSVPTGATQEEIRALVDAGVSYLRDIARIAALLYGTPDLGNKKDPVDELVYIILSRKTREGAYQDSYERLRDRFSTWDELLDAPREDVESLVWSGGLSGKKTDSLFGALARLRERFGRCTLDPAREWSNDELEAFLCSLPEISRKSAYCIMMYAFGRAVLPVDTHVGRVLARLGPYRELGLDLEGLDHKQLQRVLADLAPPNLRYSLHVNLVSHGRDVCLSVHPRCESCELRNLCHTYRKAEVARVEVLDQPTVVDLFCGAGGLSEGFHRAGYRTLAAVDFDAEATKTYRLNRPDVPDHKVLTRDIATVSASELRRMIGRRRLDVMAGAPPCQGFSHAGSRSKVTKTGYRLAADSRNFLYEHMVGLALELKPRLFLMENVPGMQSARSESLSFLDEAARRLRDGGGYRTAVWKLNAAAFGVPQDRVRCFLVASRDAMPVEPFGDYQDMHGVALDVDALPPVTLREAIFDLPQRGPGTGTAVERWDRDPGGASPLTRRYLAKFKLLRNSRLVYNHAVRYHNPRDLELYALLRPGEDSVHAVERHGRADLMRYRQDVFDDKYARLRPDRPSKTIVSHLAKDGNSYIHPDQVRSISIREAARLQSFHDGYVFCGAPTDQWIQVGNAVPPVLGEAIARSLLNVLKRKN